MPIKLPKTFARRKSYGNVLDEAQAGHNRESSSSFRVLARPNSSGKSLDAGAALRPLGVQPVAKSSFELDNEDLFSVARNDAANRGSGGTSNSLSTAPYDSGASSSRLSTTSTNPSSIDTGSGRNVKHTLQPIDDVPTPPPHTSRSGFLKNAGRTFSFGLNRNQSKEVNELPPVPALPADKNRRDTITTSRDRAMTESSVTTATPPRLDDSNFSIRGEEEDDFGNMFAGIAHKSSRENLTSMKPAPLRSAPRAAPPQPIHVNSLTHIESSPYSWTSQNSRDGLMGSPSPSRTVVQSSSQPSTLRKTTMNSYISESEDNMFENSPLRRSPEAIYNRQQYSPSRNSPIYSSNYNNRSRTQSNATTRSPQADNGDFEMPQLDPTLLANAQLANRYEEHEASPRVEDPKKVMTPAEFERYRQQKEDTRRYNKVFGKAESDDGSGDDYDDEEDDEREREVQAVQQRKKQEAHLAVYRQQMMKMTGDVPNIEPRSGSSLSGYGMADASRRMSTMTLGPHPTIQMPEEEEDEDVPLGILAAHGFPNKNRPPARLTMSHSNPSLRNLSQIQGGAAPSTNGDGRVSLPAFARNLPADPYFGAGLVHQSERVPLQMHASPSQTQLATQPQASGSSTAHPLHPAGLVGVIAGEERARAMRRGSPNPQGGFDMPVGPPQPRQSPQMQMNGFPQGMMQPPMMTPTEHAQMQMSQNMTQMMQMQMQWMQQMSSMMAQNPNMAMPGMPQMPQMPQMPGMMPHQPGTPMARPQSTPLQGMIPNSRTMSSLTPSMANWNSAPMVPQIHQNGSVYAHSIAPSERSNVGLASRYRPVSTAIQDPENMYASKRASTFTSTTFRPWQNENNLSTSKLAQSTVRPVQADDDDDEQGWAEMQARKQKKQKSWKLRKGNKDTSLQELYNAPA